MMARWRGPGIVPVSDRVSSARPSSTPLFVRYHSTAMAQSAPLTAFRIADGKTFREAQSVEIVDQLQLPHTIRWEKVETIQQAFDAIKSMKVRGFFLTKV